MSTAPSASERVAVPPADLDACRRGDRAALEALLRAESPALERLIGRLMGLRPDVEDVLQLTMIAAIEAFPRFRGEASVRTWLASIAVHTVHSHLRRAENRRPRVALELLSSEPHDDRPAADATADARRAVDLLYAHLDAIGARKRIAFILHVVEGRPMNEVAALMGATGFATKSRVFFARRELLRRVGRDARCCALLASIGISTEGAR